MSPISYTRGYVLVHLEAEDGDVGEGTHGLAVQSGAVGLGTVFEHGQAVTASDVHDGRHVARGAAHMGNIGISGRVNNGFGCDGLSA